MTLRNIIKKTIDINTEPVTNKPVRPAVKKQDWHLKHVFKSFSVISVNCLGSPQFICQF